MLDIVLHTGLEHPNVWWILVPSFLTFVAGMLIGTYADRLRPLLAVRSADTTE